MKNRVSSVIAVTLTILLASCGGVRHTDYTGGTKPVTPGLPDTEYRAVEITGKTVAPDRATPIGNVLVYVEDSISTKPQGTQLPCGTVPDAKWMATCSDENGNFTLSGQVKGKATIRLEKGVFQGILKKQFKTAGTYQKQNYNLGGSPALGSPTMAVVKGSYDSIQDILGRLGFGTLDTNGNLLSGTQTFDLFESAKYEALFEDKDKNGKANIFDYKVVFWNCGFTLDTALTEANKKILRQYVQEGGKIYASDWAYTLVEEIFPELIDFSGSDSTPATTPEQEDAAKIGTADITIKASVTPALLTWLKSQTCLGGSCVNSDNTVNIEGFLSSWVVMNALHKGADGEILTYGKMPEDKADRPLTVTLAVGKGHVTYTSYHNETSDLSKGYYPQQRILQYLIFEL